MKLASTLLATTLRTTLTSLLFTCTSSLNTPTSAEGRPMQFSGRTAFEVASDNFVIASSSTADPDRVSHVVPRYRQAHHFHDAQLARPGDNFSEHSRVESKTPLSHEANAKLQQQHQDQHEHNAGESVQNRTDVQQGIVVGARRYLMGLTHELGSKSHELNITLVLLLAVSILLNAGTLFFIMTQSRWSGDSSRSSFVNINDVNVPKGQTQNSHDAAEEVEPGPEPQRSARSSIAAGEERRLSIFSQLEERFEQFEERRKSLMTDFVEFMHMGAEIVGFDMRTEEELEAEDYSLNLQISAGLVVGYWIVGAGYGIMRQGWTVIDSIYFVVVTLSTVGYGDYRFEGHWLDKIFAGLYVFYGTAIIGAAAGLILDALSQKADAELNKLVQQEETRIAAEEFCRFDLSREIRKLYVRSLTLSRRIICAVLGGAVFMKLVERWDFSDAFYWSCVTMTTVGYGDMTPKTDIGKLFSIIFILVAFGILASAISFLASLPFEARKLKKICRVLQQFGESMDPEKLQRIAFSDEIQALRNAHQKETAKRQNDLHVTRAEFVLWQLLRQEKIKMDKDVRPCLGSFDALDRDGSGRLDEADIQKAVRKKKRSVHSEIID